MKGHAGKVTVSRMALSNNEAKQIKEADKTFQGSEGIRSLVNIQKSTRVGTIP
jgi:hypothetical protein